MADEPGGMQFDKAEPAAGGTATGTPTCAKCGKPIVDSYYEAGGNVFDANCAKEIRGQVEEGRRSASFPRALVFGVVGAAAGAAVYYAVVAITGYEIGLISILVGFMVGWTVRAGSRGFGGRRYQVLAFLLCYLAIAATYTGVAARQLVQEGKLVTSRSELATPDTSVISVTGAVKSSGTVGAFAWLVLITLAMPVISVLGSMPGGLISALIIGFGLRQAWIMNGAVDIKFSGPFRVGSGPAAAPA